MASTQARVPSPADQFRNFLQPVVPDAERLQVLDRVEHIFLVAAGAADRSLHDRRRLGLVERARILVVLAVDDVAKRGHRA